MKSICCGKVLFLYTVDQQKVTSVTQNIVVEVCSISRWTNVEPTRTKYEDFHCVISVYVKKPVNKILENHIFEKGISYRRAK